MIYQRELGPVTVICTGDPHHACLVPNYKRRGFFCVCGALERATRRAFTASYKRQAGLEALGFLDKAVETPPTESI